MGPATATKGKVPLPVAPLPGKVSLDPVRKVEEFLEDGQEPAKAFRDTSDGFAWLLPERPEPHQEC
jgi:hypothetical protein